MASTISRSNRGPETEDETELNHHSLDDLEVVDGEENVEENDSGIKKRKREPVKNKRSRRTSPYWADFEEYKDENGAGRVKCIHFEANYVYDSNTHGNKNLSQHWQKCKKNPANAEKGTKQTLLVDSNGKMKAWTFDAVVLNKCIIEMVIIDEMPFQAFEKSGFVKSIFNAVPQFKVSGHMTVQREIYKLYVEEREKLKMFMKKSCQGICLTTDTWTSSNMTNYMCVTGHFIDNDWNLQKRVLNFCPIHSHKGQNIAKALEDCLRFWDLDKKLLTVTVDNASSNDVACVHLSDMAREKGCITKGKYMHVRCMAHILNLIVQDGIKECGQYVATLRAIIKYIRGSSARRHNFREVADMCKVGCKKSLKNDVCTRWNSTYDMLMAALPYRVVFSRMDIPYLDDSDLCPLSSSDWNKLEGLAHYLKEFYEITVSVSGSMYTTSNDSVFHIARVVEILRKLAADKDSCLHKMSCEMQKKCDKYWGSFDRLNLLMFVPAILDPMVKLLGVTHALQQMFNEDNVEPMVNAVKEYAYDLFGQYVSLYAISESNDSESVSNSLHGDAVGPTYVQGLKANLCRGNLDRDELSSSEFDMYLRDRNVAYEGDVLKCRMLHEPSYSILSRMARDVLAIPVSTVPSESTFSAGGRILKDFRNCLKDKNVQALICTQDWLRAETKPKKGKSVEEEEDSEDENDEGLFYS